MNTKVRMQVGSNIQSINPDVKKYQDMLEFIQVRGEKSNKGLKPEWNNASKNLPAVDPLSYLFSRRSFCSLEPKATDLKLG